LLNTGDTPVTSRARMLTTIAYQLEGKRTYALEGAIFVAGAAVQWLRDGLRLVATAAETGTLAAQADPADQVYMVPAFAGLGAPWWDAEARGALYGLSRKSGPAEISRAALESVGYQTRDLLAAMRADWPVSQGAGTVLRVDGGMAASDYTMQFLADILDVPVDRPAFMETTALGAAYLAGRKAGVYPDLDGFAATWKLDRRFDPAMDAPIRAAKWNGWQDAVQRTLSGRGSN
jgi:glycerol kinase